MKRAGVVSCFDTGYIIGLPTLSGFGSWDKVFAGGPRSTNSGGVGFRAVSRSWRYWPFGPQISLALHHRGDEPEPGRRLPDRFSQRRGPRTLGVLDIRSGQGERSIVSQFSPSRFRFVPLPFWSLRRPPGKCAALWSPRLSAPLASRPSRVPERDQERHHILQSSRRTLKLD